MAKLAKEDVPDYVKAAYNSRRIEIWLYYIIPKPFDERSNVYADSVAAVAEAAIKDGVARVEDFDINLYKEIYKK